MVLNGTASFGDVQAQWKPEDDIAEGQLLFLKGQLRILTVLALLAVVHRRKATLSEATCQNMSKSSCKGGRLPYHICVPMSKQDSFCSVLIQGASDFAANLAKGLVCPCRAHQSQGGVVSGLILQVPCGVWVWEPLDVVFEVQPLGMLSEVLQLQGGCEGEHPHSPICCDLGK